MIQLLAYVVLGVPSALFAVAPATNARDAARDSRRGADKPFATASLEPKSGSKAHGTVEFFESKNGLNVRARVQDVSSGKHGIHVHANGDCSADNATSAGDHFDPLKTPHGGPAATQRHVGDLGNIEVGENGQGYLNLQLKANSKSERMAWKDIVGKSVVLHAAEDDLKSQPSGNSGDRIACGVVRGVIATVP